LKLVLTPGWYADRVSELTSEFPQLDVVSPASHEDFAREMVDADILFGWLGREQFVAARKLRWLQSGGAGVEWLARIPEVAGSGVAITNTRGAHAATIAEHTFAMLLALTRCTNGLWEMQQQHRWATPPGARPVGISGLTFGVIGLGNIGRAIAKRAAAFDTHVLAVDMFPGAKPDYVAELWGLPGLPRLLAESDIVVVATPLTAETTGMLGADRLALMKPTAYLAVISRGGIVDEPALAGALRSGKLAGACLDVTGQEPLPEDSELWTTPNLLLSPHTSGASRQTDALVWSIFVANLRRFLAGQPLENLVDIGRGF
jgi:phosphoglycerate dehydrogenase-like enzyme